MMDGVDPTYEYINAPKEVIDFTELAQRNPMMETHADKWFDAQQQLQAEQQLFEPTEDADLEQEYQNFVGQSANFDAQSEASYAPSIHELGRTLTVPRSPHFLTTERARMRGHCEADEIRRTQQHDREPARQWEPKLTVPESPQFFTTHRKRKPAEPTEELAMRKVQEQMEREAKKRKMFDHMRSKAFLPGTSYIPERSAVPLTEPQEFSFWTEDRARYRHPEQEKAPSPKRKKTANYGGITVPEPFSFLSDDRAMMRTANGEHTSDAQPYLSLSQQAMNWAPRTTTTNKKLPRATKFTRMQQQQQQQPWQPTVPVGFSFLSDERAELRPKEYQWEILSSAERELLEFEQMPKFKARPLDKKIFEHNTFKVPETKPLTVPETFHFATDERLKRFPSYQAEEALRTTGFRESVLRSTNGLNSTTSSSAHLEVTTPHSPALSTKQRAQMKSVLEEQKRQAEEEAAAAHQFKARPMPRFVNHPVEVKPVSHSLTEPAPFHLHTEDRGELAETKLMRQLEEEKKREEMQRQFKARPMPVYDDMSLSFDDGTMDRSLLFQLSSSKPHHEVKLTEPEPFPLQTEQRGQLATQNFKIRVDEELQEQKQRAQFKALPYAPKNKFEVAKSTKPLTEISEVTLNSDRRAMKRQRWEHEKLAKEMAYLEAKKQLEQELFEREQAALKEYRKTLVHKAQPVLHGRPVHLKQSTMPLTEPQSPFLSTKKRLGMRDL